MKSASTLVLLFLVPLQAFAWDWVKLESDDGRELEARIQSLEGEVVTITTRSDQVFEVPLSRLSTGSVEKVERWQREVGSKLELLENLKNKFVRSLQEKVSFTAEELPPFRAYFYEARPIVHIPMGASADRIRRESRREQRLVREWERRRNRALMEYRGALRRSLPGIEFSEIDPRLVLRNDYSMAVNDIMRIIAGELERGMNEDFLLQWLRSDSRPYHEVRGKFHEFRNQLQGHSGEIPQAASYLEKVREILASMEQISRTRLEEERLKELRLTIRQNLESLGIARELFF